MKYLRLTELLLSLMATAITAAGFAQLTLAQKGTLVWPTDLAPALYLGSALLITHMALVLRQLYERFSDKAPGAERRRPLTSDQVVLPVAGMLAGLGLVLTHRLAPALAGRQNTWVLLGWATITLVAGIPWPLRWLRRYRYTWAFLGLLLVAFTLLFGVRPSEIGPRLWLRIGPLLFQPSELLKILLVIFLASYLAEYRELVAFGSVRIGRLRLPPIPYLAPIVVIWSISMLLLIWQRDLGAGLIFFGIFLAMLYVVSSRWTYVAGSLGLFLVGTAAIIHTFEHVQHRVTIWLDPWPQATEGAYQIVQALIALASGGILGPGLGYGYPTYIPAVHTDFVFAAIAEEMGLAGALAVIGLYLLLVFRGFHIALRTDSAFEKLLAIGISSVFGLQTLIILGGNLRLIPLTGVTLPFVSYGGSSLTTSALMIGLLLRIRIVEGRPQSTWLPRPSLPAWQTLHQSTLHLAGVLFAGFLTVGMAIPYWNTVHRDELVQRPDNPRLIEAERRLDRGHILDSRGEILALTTFDDQGIARREYPYPPLAPVVGFWSIQYGTTGIESTLNDPLRARPMDFETRLNTWLFHRPVVGHDVVLTIDSALQQIADTALGDARGALVLLDARSGAIRALASHPTFDPNNLETDFEKLKADASRPLLNRATQGLYPPGSTFKTVTLAAALEEGLVRPDQVFQDGDETLYVDGFPIRCNNNPRNVNEFDLAHAYAYSCNLTFARLGLELGTKRFKEYAGRFQIDRPVPLEIPTSAGQIANHPLLMSQVLLASSAFGQGELLVTPLHMALVAATIANDGTMPQPHLVERVQTRAGDPLPNPAAPDRPTLGNPITPQTARQVREMMVVSVQEGYARQAQIPGAVVGGKTGTAQLGGANTRPHAWFIGWAQAQGSDQAPAYAIAVVVENGGEGSQVATPIAQRVLQAALERPAASR